MANTQRGSLYVVSGPSGTGKGTLIARLVKLVPDVWVSVSATTRQPRAGEVDGVQYRFMGVEEFKQLIASGGFIEWAEVHGNYYGTPLGPIEEKLAAGQDVLLEIDVQGAFQVRRVLPDAKLVFIAPPSLEVLEQRLRGRATDSEETIRRRMSNALGEMDAAPEYDYLIVNDDLERATEELLEVVQS